MDANPTRLDYHQLESRIARWAAYHPDLLAGVIVGSRGRPGAAADEWSDLDLIIFTTNPDPYIKDSSWLADFGELWASYLDTTGSGYPERFALYAGGLKVDIVFVKSDPAQSLAEMLSQFAFQDVIQRGVRVLFDKTGNKAVFPALAGPEALPPLPTEEEFSAALQRFWIKAAKAAKLALRGDLWRTKQACDSELKACLLEMLEWHARTAYRPGSDTLYEGRFLDKWADPKALSALPATFAAYDQADIQRALVSTVGLYLRLAEETAASQAYAYPPPNHSALQNWLLEMLSDPEQ